ncbi:hypothetical protein K474DRAFT_1522181 [Panus rudis PR-1116 ss-1]|nr:hypothetical protein K474DRAFT_1522181 [Panus rudis PR-1116 ss-1]
MLWRKPPRPLKLRFNRSVPMRQPLWRAPNHSFSTADYQGYVRLRVSLLQTPAIANAALRAGGMLWRLALESIVDVRRVLHGSCDDLIIQPSVVHLDNREYIETVLPQDIQDCLCGTYSYFTAKSRNTLISDPN